MSIEQNRTIARRIAEELFNQGKLSVADELFKPDFAGHPEMEGSPRGVQGLKQFVTDLRGAYPDLHYSVEDVIADADRFCMRVSASGTFKNAFMGMQPTNKHASWTEVHISRVSGGKVVETWHTMDMLDLFLQLGLVSKDIFREMQRPQPLAA
jgi:predicted ester cyclase